jgi:hypothetical protein
MGYTNFSQIQATPCNLLLGVRSIGKIDGVRTGNILKLITESEYTSHDLVRFLVINGKLKDTVLADESLYEQTLKFIWRADFEGLKRFHKLSGYDFKTPYDEQSLITIALSFTNHESDNINIFKYILDNAGDYDEHDYEVGTWFLDDPDLGRFIEKDADGHYITVRNWVPGTKHKGYYSPAVLKLLEKY